MPDPDSWTKEEAALLAHVVLQRTLDPATSFNQPNLQVERDVYRQLLIKYLRVILKNEGIDYLSPQYFDKAGSFTDSELALIQLISSKVEGHYK